MITLQHVSKQFGRVNALNDVTVHLPKGVITAVIGPNASGKTTLNRIVLGLVRPDSGVVSIDGERIGDRPDYRAKIGYMPQAARYPDNLSAADVFAMLADLRGTDQARDTELIETLGIKPYFKVPLWTLSGGMRQRVSAALAFYFNPPILVLDEPTSALDPLSSATFKDKVLRSRARGTTVVITSHILSELDALAEHIVLLLDGRVHFAGPRAHLVETTGESTLERAVVHLLRQHAAGDVRQELGVAR
jgi:Cu-processing system ATP-binding protein